MPASLRALYELNDPALRAACSAELLAHRDFIYREHLERPARVPAGTSRSCSCVAAVTTVLFQRLRQPVVLGYMLAG